MKSTTFGEIVLSEQDILDGLYSGKITDLETIFLDDPDVCKIFNESVKKNYDNVGFVRFYTEPTISMQEFDRANQDDWFMPKEYKDFEIVGFLLDQTQNEEQYQRVVTELELFIQHNMIDLLKYLKYLVDTMRSNNIVWGVGRGSSVASYCLYLLGVHKIDSIKYELDIHEFLKEKQNG
jgi:DNA polymerase III alpha subunit